MCCTTCPGTSVQAFDGACLRVTVSQILGGLNGATARRGGAAGKYYLSALDSGGGMASLVYDSET